MPQREVPEQTYFPSAKVRLTVRLDEFGQTTRLLPAPAKTTKNLNGIKDERADLQVVPDPAAPAGTHRFLLLPKGQTAAPPATSQARSADGLTFDVTVVPKEMDWNQNGIRTADTLQLVFKYIDLPIDPRCVRACAVEAFLGTVTASEFQAGIEGAKRQGATVAGDGEPLNVVPDNYQDPVSGQRTNSRFLGWVDKWEVDWNDTDEPTVRLECRDNTQLLIEQEVPPKLVLDMTKGIDEAIALYLSHFPQMQGISIEYRPAGTTPPKLKDVLLNTAFRPKLGPQPGKGGSGTQKFAVWDYLTDICGSIGHAIRVQGTLIVVQTARSLTTKAITHRADDPFQGRTVAGAQFDYRRFIYGRNVKEMRLSRNFAKQTPANVEVRAYSGERKTVIVARFPQPEDRIRYAIPGDAQPDQKWTVLRVAGIKDEKTLRAVAQTVYESIGRNELQVELKTRNLASFGGGNLDPDILDMQAGDTFELLVSREPVPGETNTLTRIEQALSAQVQGALFLTRLGMSDEFAAAYAKAYTDAGFLTTFRMKQAKIHWNITEGVDLSIIGVNYIEVRADKSLPADEEPEVPQQGGPSQAGAAPPANNPPQPVNQGF